MPKQHHSGAELHITQMPKQHHSGAELHITQMPKQHHSGAEVDVTQVPEQTSLGCRSTHHFATFSAEVWTHRPFTVLAGNTGFCEILSDGSLRLEAGEYEVSGWAIALAVKSHRARLAVPSTTEFLVWGDSAYGNSWVDSRSFLAGGFTLASQTVVQLEHRCALTQPSWGFGYRSNLGPEIYVQLILNRY